MKNEQDEIIATYVCTDFGCEKYGRVFYLNKNGSIFPNSFTEAWTE